MVANVIGANSTTRNYTITSSGVYLVVVASLGSQNGSSFPTVIAPLKLNSVEQTIFKTSSISRVHNAESNNVYIRTIINVFYFSALSSGDILTVNITNNLLVIKLA